jgi:fatty acid/phospholipid biosynthesis enzyme
MAVLPMKAHGSAKERSIMNAIRIATESVQHQLNETIRIEIERANALLPIESLTDSNES